MSDFGKRTTSLITSWKDPVPTYGDLPLTGNNPGDARVVLNESKIYVWNGTAWVPADSDEQDSLFMHSVKCQATDAVGDWCNVIATNEVEKLSDNTDSNVLGVICRKMTATLCDVIIAGRAALFTGLDVTKPRYFLGTDGVLTFTPPTTGYVIELGQPLTSTTLVVGIKISMKRAV